MRERTRKNLLLPGHSCRARFALAVWLGLTAIDGVFLVGWIASFFVSRIDTLVDEKLERLAAESTDATRRQGILSLRGRIAIANAKLAYVLYREERARARAQDKAARERSRELPNIVLEAERIASEGFKQITLLGQNVNSHRNNEHDFADLMQAVSEVSGIARVRFTSPHPKDFPRKLLHTMAANPKLCKHIHLPLQAGSDRILDLMARTYTRKEYLRLVEEIRRTIPGIALTTDIIVGFPTETEEDFQETAGLFKDSQFDSAYIFKYSERKGTIASRKYPDDVPPEVKTDRIVRLIELQRAISLQKNREKIGRTLTVLIDGEADGPGKGAATSKRPGHQMGKTEGNTTVVFPRTSFGPGTMVSVRIDDVSSSTLYGRSVER